MYEYMPAAFHFEFNEYLSHDLEGYMTFILVTVIYIIVFEEYMGLHEIV